MANLKLSTNPSGTEGYLKLGESTGLTMKADGKVVGVPSSSETEAGMLPIATISDALSLVNDTKALTPKKLADAFKGGNQSFGVNGYQKLPGGMILQWGNRVLASDQSGFANITFPVTFPSQVVSVVANDVSNNLNKSAIGCVVLSTSQMQLTWYRVQGTSTTNALWLAIGY